MFIDSYTKTRLENDKLSDWSRQTSGVHHGVLYQSSPLSL